MCSSGSNNRTQTTTQSQTSTTRPDDQVLDAYRRLVSGAESTATTPWNPNTAQQIAGFNTDQQNAFSNIRSGIAAPYISSAANYTQAGAGNIAGNIASYQNPWTDQVVDATQRDFDVANKRQQSGVVGDARMRGSLGGDREAVAQALTAEAQNRTQAPIIANLRSHGFNTALSAAQNEAARSLQGAGIMSSLAPLAYTDTSALLGIGGQQQQNTQAQLDANSANAAAQSSYPFQTQQWLAGILGAATPNMGSTTTSTGTSTGVSQGPTPNTWSQAIGAGIAAIPYLAAGGAVERAAGGGIGYVPQVPELPRGGLPASPAMAMQPMSMGGGEQSKGFADHWKEIQSTAKNTSDAMKGISQGANDLGKWMNSSTTPGGWNTTTDYGSAMSNLSAGISNIMKLAVGGAVEDKNDPAGSYDLPSAKPSPGGIGSDMPLMDIARMRVSESPPEPPPQMAPARPVVDVDARPQISGSPMGGAGEAYALPPPTLGQGPLNPTNGVAGWSSQAPIRTESAPIPAQGIGERFMNWIGSDDAKNTLTPMGLAMMAASREGGKGTTGVHFGIGGMEGLKSQAAFRKGEREKEIEQAKLKLAQQAQELRDAESGRAAAMHPYDIAFKQAQTKAMNAQAATKEDPTQVFKIREKEAKRIGLDEKSEAFREYVLTGRMPRQELGATAQKQILESEEVLANTATTKKFLDTALSLNDKAFSGMLANERAWAMSQFPKFMQPDGTMETREMGRVMMQQVLANLKSTFGAAPTEGERKILIDVEAAINATPEERKGVIERAKQLLESREKLHTRMLNDLRGGTMFKPQASPPASAPASTPDPLGLRP